MTVAQRVVDRVAVAIAGRGFSRRRFLQRAAVVGSALAVDPTGYVLKPRTAYATVCGDEPECHQGWTAFCCTISGGANLCPPGSFAGGWWKVDGSAFCRGQARYYVDCNRLPESSCQCGCADGPCDHRRVCCNVFRYGQCNQHIAAKTEVVCRVVLCTPPWEWDQACSATARTDDATGTHSATCLPGQDPTYIEIKYQDLGLTGSVLGRVVEEERETTSGDGRVAVYEVGLILWRDDLGAHTVHGDVADRYQAMGQEASELGYPIADQGPVADGRAAHFEHGTIWDHRSHGMHITTGPIHDLYVDEGGAGGWLGFPITDIFEQDDGTLRMVFEHGAITHDPGTGETRAEEHGHPDVERWGGANRLGTAAIVAQRAFPETVSVVHVARSDGFADALGGGLAAARSGGPLLLTSTDELPDVTAEELTRLAPGRVIVVGGREAIEPPVVERVRSVVDARVGRIAGDDRYETAAQLVAQYQNPDATSVVYLASGESFADALAGTPLAARDRAPLLLTRPDALPEPTRDQLDLLAPIRIVLLGGPAAISETVEQQLRRRASEVERIAGADRFETAAAVGGRFETPEAVFVVNGRDFPDALSAGPAAAGVGAPILLVEADRVPEPTASQLDRLRPARIVVVGGRDAVATDVLLALVRYTRG